MIQVKMKTMYAGPKGNCQPGGTIFVDDDEAKGLVDGNYAEFVLKPVVIEDDDTEVVLDVLVPIEEEVINLHKPEKTKGKDKSTTAVPEFSETKE